MEGKGADTLFERSFEKLGLHYATYIGDAMATCIHLFGLFKFIDKEDCVLYVAKRMGSGLRDIFKSY